MGATTRGNGGGGAASSARARRSPTPLLLLLLLVALASAAPTTASALGTNNQLLFTNGTTITLERRRAPEQKPARRGGEDRSNDENAAAALAQACCIPLSGGAQAVSAVDPAFSLHSDPSCSPGSRLCALPATTARAVWVCGCGSGGGDNDRCFGGRAAAAATSGSGSALGDPQKDSGAKGGGQVQGGAEAFLRGEGAVVAVRVAVAASSGGKDGGKGGKGSSSSSSSSSRCPLRGLQFEYTGGATLTIGTGFDGGALEVKELALLPGEALVAMSGRVVGAGGGSSASSSSSSSRRGGSGGRVSSSSSSSSSSPCLAYVSLATSRGRELSAGRKKSGSSSSSSSSSSRGESGGGLAVARAPGGGGNNNQNQRLVAAEALVRADGSLGWLRPLWGHDGCPAAAASSAPASPAAKPNAAAPAAANAPPKTAGDAGAAKNKPTAPTKPDAGPASPAQSPASSPAQQQQQPSQQQPQPQPQSPPRPPSNPYPLCGPPADPVCDRSTTPPRCFCMTDPPDNFLGQTCPEDGSCLGGCCATTGQCPRVMGREAPKGYSGGPVQFFLARGCADWGLQPSLARTVAEGKARNASEAAAIVLPACGKGVPMVAEGKEGAAAAAVAGAQRPECGALYECVPPRGRPCAPGLPGALCMGYTRCKDESQCVGMSNEAACVYRPDGTKAFDVCGCRPIYPPPTAVAASERRRRRRLVF